MAEQGGICFLELVDRFDMAVGHDQADGPASWGHIHGRRSPVHPGRRCVPGFPQDDRQKMHSSDMIRVWWISWCWGCRGRDFAISRAADDVVIFQFDRFIGFGGCGGFLAHHADVIQVLAHVRIPVARQDHQRITDAALGHIAGAHRVGRVAQRHPVVHQGSARVDGETQPVAGFARDFDCALGETAARPDIRRSVSCRNAARGSGWVFPVLCG